MVSATAWGGMENHTLCLMDALKRSGCEVSLIEFGQAFFGQALQEKGTAGGIDYVHVKESLNTVGLVRLLLLFCRNRGDAALLAKGDMHAGSWRLDFACRLRYSHFVTIEHKETFPLPARSSKRHFGGIIPGFGLWWYRARLKIWSRSVCPRHVYCVSDSIARGLIDHHGFSPQKVTAVANGIDTSRFRPSRECAREIRRRLDIPESAMVFGAVGRFHFLKGFDLALDLFKEVLRLKRDIELRLVLVGNGPERRNLERQRVDQTLEGNVVLMDFTARPWEVYPAFDVFLMPSRQEGLPLSLLEAMAAGCCPIAMGVGGIPDVMTRPELGWVVPPQDRAGFLAAMKAAVRIGPCRVREKGVQARRHIVANFEADNQFSKLAGEIATGLDPPPAREIRQA